VIYHYFTFVNLGVRHVTQNFLRGPKNKKRLKTSVLGRKGIIIVPHRII